MFSNLLIDFAAKLLELEPARYNHACWQPDEYRAADASYWATQWYGDMGLRFNDTPIYESLAIPGVFHGFAAIENFFGLTFGECRSIFGDSYDMPTALIEPRNVAYRILLLLKDDVDGDLESLVDGAMASRLFQRALQN